MIVVKMERKHVQSHSKEPAGTACSGSNYHSVQFSCPAQCSVHSSLLPALSLCMESALWDLRSIHPLIAWISILQAGTALGLEAGLSIKDHFSAPLCLRGSWKPSFGRATIYFHNGTAFSTKESMFSSEHHSPSWEQRSLEHAFKPSAFGIPGT